MMPEEKEPRGKAEIFASEVTGYRAGELDVSTGSVATEGEGLYVTTGKDAKQLAKRFESPNNPIRRVDYIEPKNPLIVENEPMPILTGENEELVYEAIEPSDSEWVRLQKEAMQRLIKRNLVEPGQMDLASATDLASEVGKLAREKGYDAIRVTYGGGSWDVLLDENLWEGAKSEVVTPEVEVAGVSMSRWLTPTEFANLVISAVESGMDLEEAIRTIREEAEEAGVSDEVIDEGIGIAEGHFEGEEEE